MLGILLTMLKDKLLKWLTLEGETANALKAKLDEVIAANKAQKIQIDALLAQDIVDQAKAAELQEATDLVEARLAELNAINPNPVADAMAAEIAESPIVITPTVITADAAIGASEPTSEEALPAIAESEANLLAAEPEEAA